MNYLKENDIFIGMVFLGLGVYREVVAIDSGPGDRLYLLASLEAFQGIKSDYSGVTAWRTLLELNAMELVRTHVTEPVVRFRVKYIGESRGVDLVNGRIFDCLGRCMADFLLVVDAVGYVWNINDSEIEIVTPEKKPKPAIQEIDGVKYEVTYKKIEEKKS